MGELEPRRLGLEPLGSSSPSRTRGPARAPRGADKQPDRNNNAFRKKNLGPILAPLGRYRASRSSCCRLECLSNEATPAFGASGSSCRLGPRSSRQHGALRRVAALDPRDPPAAQRPAKKKHYTQGLHTETPRTLEPRDSLGPSGLETPRVHGRLVYSFIDICWGRHVYIDVACVLHV